MNNQMISALVLCFTFFSLSANAVTVNYDLTNLGGSSYSASFSIVNDSSVLPIEDFAILFDYTDFQNLAATSMPADWFDIVIEPDTILPDDGRVEWIGFDGGIGLGSALVGFDVTFDYLGSGLPSSLPFEILDPLTFSVLQSGTATQVSQVPVPGAFWLFASALIGLFGRSIKSA